MSSIKRLPSTFNHIAEAGNVSMRLCDATEALCPPT